MVWRWRCLLLLPYLMIVLYLGAVRCFALL